MLLFACKQEFILPIFVALQIEESNYISYQLILLSINKK